MGGNIGSRYLADNCHRKPHFTLIWTVENASGFLTNGCAESPSFIVQSIEKTKWKMSFGLLCGGFIELALHREDNGTDSIEIDFELSFLDENGYCLRTETAGKEFKSKHEGRLRLFQHYKEVFSLRKYEFLPNDTLTLRCQMWKTGSEISRADMCFARTRLGMDKRCFIWAIRAFRSLQPGHKSKPFLCPGGNGSPQLILRLFISEKNDKSYINIEMEQKYATTDHLIICKFSLLDDGGKVVHSKEIHTFISVNSLFNRLPHELFERDKVLYDESSLLPNDVLSLRCEFQIGAEPVWSRIENYRYSNLEDIEWIEKGTSGLQLADTGENFLACCPFNKAFIDLYGDRRLSDVRLCVDEKSLPAHKNVLSARSPVFKTMFTRRQRGPDNKIVNIPDMDYETLELLLQYIYTGKVEKLNFESAMHLFTAAVKYQLLDLRKYCSSFLRWDISKSNVCSVLSLACMHGDNDLREFAEEIMSNYGDEVFASDAWKEFKKENFALALEITERIIHLIHENNRKDLLWGRSNIT